MKKPSRKVREEAILLCSILASTPHADLISAAIATGADAAVGLVDEAWWAAFKGGSSFDFIDAEAECLLREGWCP